MLNLRRSIAAKLALWYGVMVAATTVVVSASFYFGTIGELDRGMDRKISMIADHMLAIASNGSYVKLTTEVDRLLSDQIDSDSELFQIAAPDGRPVAGNLSAVAAAALPLDRLVFSEALRDGKAVPVRLLVRSLPNGGRLVVGRDLSEQTRIRNLVWRSLAIGAGISLLLVFLGALLFRRQIETRIGDIRRIALEIEAGDLTHRIPDTADDEFGRLNRDINRMLERIENLMEGVRNVSNAIAHDLRTPLSRIRSKLDEAVRHNPTAERLTESAHCAIEEIDDLMLIFEQLLQIAEAESGMRQRSFGSVDLSQIVTDLVELYDANAAEKQVSLTVLCRLPVRADGDRNLLGNALASLIDNAIKYAGSGATVEVDAFCDLRGAGITVRDNGPGIPAAELDKVTQRFYRLDKSRSLPGNGLGLSIVRAIAVLHGGQLYLENATPGLIARIVLPH